MTAQSSHTEWRYRPPIGPFAGCARSPGTTKPITAVRLEFQGAYRHAMVFVTTSSPETGRLAAIPGDPPDPTEIPPGCPFAPRCPFVMPVCREVNPAPVVVGPHHRAACHLLTGAGAESQSPLLKREA